MSSSNPRERATRARRQRAEHSRVTRYEHLGADSGRPRPDWMRRPELLPKRPPQKGM